jgi:hypothetical protein
VLLHIDLVDEAGNANTTVASLDLPCLAAMKQPNVPTREKYLLKGPDGGDAHGALLELEVTYMEAKVGALLVTLFEGRNLKNKEVLGKQDPYITFNIGEKYKKKSAVCLDGGVNPHFKEEKVNMWVDRKNWVHDLHVQAWDEDDGADDLIGQVPPPTNKEINSC